MTLSQRTLSGVAEAEDRSRDQRGLQAKGDIDQEGDHAGTERQQGKQSAEQAQTGLSRANVLGRSSHAVLTIAQRKRRPPNDRSLPPPEKRSVGCWLGRPAQHGVDGQLVALEGVDGLVGEARKHFKLAPDRLGIAIANEGFHAMSEAFKEDAQLIEKGFDFNLGVAQRASRTILRVSHDSVSY
jgi:hypothetical protein